MKDPRMTSLAQLLVSHSTKLQPGENLLIEAFDIPPEYTAELIRVAREAGANVFVHTYHAIVQRRLLLGINRETVDAQAAWDKARMEHMQAYIGLRGGYNYAESADIPDEVLKLWSTRYGKPVHLETRVPKTKWVVLRWPSPSMAQQAGMSTEAFEDFYFRVCTADYAKMAKAVEPLRELMSKTDRVRITGPGTDLTFSIKDIPCVPCCGEKNIPDGEIYTAPVKDSINGVVRINTESLRDGTVFTGVKLVVKDGRIQEATAQTKTDKLNSILDTDEGARYFGEFAIGFNPFILHPMKDTLFDEKIAGSFHITPGNAYEEADNGNRSAVHWDFVCIQREDYGGGEIYFDDVLIRKNGLFVPLSLTPLNPENLM